MLRSAYGDPGQVTANDVDQYYAAVGQADYGRALRGVLRSYDFDALRGRLDAIRTPTLIIWGGADRWIPPAVGRHLAAGLSRVAFVLLPQAGHALPDEAPERATELLLGFLERGVPQVPGDLATGTRVDGPDLQGNIINHSVENE
jgi:pimeloyl-ACP methyl ester carboxylesterase